jgi:hypothetical protein
MQTTQVSKTGSFDNGPRATARCHCLSLHSSRVFFLLHQIESFGVIDPSYVGHVSSFAYFLFVCRWVVYVFYVLVGRTSSRVTASVGGHAGVSRLFSRAGPVSAQTKHASQDARYMNTKYTRASAIIGV